MFNVCPACGVYDVEKEIDPAGPFAVCPHCGYAHPFRQLPLFIVTGASGSGKTSACLALVSQMPECVVLESDILWGRGFDTPEDGYRGYRDIWLRVAKNIGQNGRPVALFGSALPEQFETLLERRYFTTIHYLALVCDDALLAARLRVRPAWRQADAPAFIAAMQAFNRRLKAEAAGTTPTMSAFDTGDVPLAATVGYIARWIRGLL